MRVDGRMPHEMRKLTLETNVNMYAEGSVLMGYGNTKVLCTVSLEERVPFFMRGSGKGWITAEYAMLPRATDQRNSRERGREGLSGRSQEIQRLIGRSMRTVFHLDELGERSLLIDCDVLQADGGTRTASITASWVATMLALNRLVQENKLKRIPVLAQAAAVSVGIVDNTALLDLCYQEDSRAEVDMNVVITANGELIEVQGTGEQSTFSRQQLNTMLDMAEAGLQEVFALQRAVLHEQGVHWRMN